MKLIYDSSTIEQVFNALNNLQISGLQNAEIVTFITQSLNKNEPVKEDEQPSSNKKDG